MADTSPRKSRIRLGTGLTLDEKNREGGSIPQGNEAYGNFMNLVRGFLAFQNIENLNQPTADYIQGANSVYNEIDLLIRSILMNNTKTIYPNVSFSANLYTLDAPSVILSEAVPVANGNQEYSDVNRYLAPESISSGFISDFLATDSITGSTSVRFRLYDGSFSSTYIIKKYNSLGTSLINLVANDIVKGRKYSFRLIGSDIVLIDPDLQSKFDEKVSLSFYANSTLGTSLTSSVFKFPIKNNLGVLVNAILQYEILPSGTLPGNRAFPQAFPNAALGIVVSNTDRQGTRVDCAFGSIVSTSEYYSATKASTGDTLTSAARSYFAIGW